MVLWFACIRSEDLSGLIRVPKSRMFTRGISGNSKCIHDANYTNRRAVLIKSVPNVLKTIHVPVPRPPVYAGLPTAFQQNNVGLIRHTSWSYIAVTISYQSCRRSCILFHLIAETTNLHTKLNVLNPCPPHLIHAQIPKCAGDLHFS